MTMVSKHSVREAFRQVPNRVRPEAKDLLREHIDNYVKEIVRESSRVATTNNRVITRTVLQKAISNLKWRGRI